MRPVRLSGKLAHRAGARSQPSVPELTFFTGLQDRYRKTLRDGIWVELDGRVALQGEDGRVVEVAAIDVYAAAFRSASTVAGISVSSPLAQLPTLSFSRVPAPPAVRMSGSVLSPLIELGVWASGRYAALNAGSDQVVQNRQWHPVDARSVADAEEWLNSSQIDRARPGLREIIRLRQATAAPFRLVDETVAADPRESKDQTHLDTAGLNGTLYPYQVAGAAFLGMVAQQGVGCLLADEMGLGKTLQVIALLQSEHRVGRGPSLVVAPATLLENWRRELQRFAPKLQVLVHAGGERAGIPAILRAFDVVVTSYDIVVRDEPLLAQVAWNVLTLDEAQSIRNPDARRTIAAKALPRRVSVAVTGTPVENKLEDLWSLSDFCLPGLLGDLPAFRGRFENNLSDAQHLGRVVAPVILRRRLAEVATDLPSRIEIPQPLRMSQRMADAYENIRQPALSAGGPARLEAAVRLRQLCAHPSLLAPWSDDPADDMPKYELLLQLMEEILERHQKALIFGGFQDLLDLILHDLATRWPNGTFAVIDGRTPVEDRQSIVDRFSAASGGGALILNPRAAGTGLNITTANHVIHFTPEWNPAVTAQASARSFRRGQTLPATVHHLYFADSVEESMIARAAFKRDLAQGAVTGHDGEADATNILEALHRSPLSAMRTIASDHADH